MFKNNDVIRIRVKVDEYVIVMVDVDRIIYFKSKNLKFLTELKTKIKNECARLWAVFS